MPHCQYLFKKCLNISDGFKGTVLQNIFFTMVFSKFRIFVTPSKLPEDVAGCSGSSKMKNCVFLLWHCPFKRKNYSHDIETYSHIFSPAFPMLCISLRPSMSIWSFITSATERRKGGWASRLGPDIRHFYMISSVRTNVFLRRISGIRQIFFSGHF